MRDGKRWVAGLFVTGVLTWMAYLWIDRPVAFWSHANLHQYESFRQMTLVTGWFPSTAIVLIAAIGLLKLTGRPVDRPLEAIFLCSLSLVVARAAKDQLKFVFGRTWPETWVDNNPSLIRDGAFGFNPFHGGIGYEAFPSGHTTAICAVVTVLWLYYPKFRILYLIPIAVVSIGLLGANYHFVSDIIGGGFVGASAAIFCVSMCGNRMF